MKLAPALRVRSFKRRGRTFAKPTDDLYHCLQVQASQWNTPEAASFTANVLVVWPRWHEIWVGQPFPSNPASAVPVAEDRVGILVSGRDHWWEVRPDTDIESLGQEVTFAVDRACDQFFPQFQTSADLLQRLDAGQPLPGLVPTPLIHATLLVAAGRSTEARAELTSMVAEKPDWQVVPLVIERLGLAGAA